MLKTDEQHVVLATPTRIKHGSSRRLILQLIREEGAISRAEIARRLQLSRPTASRIVDALEQEGYIACTGKSAPTGGRLGELYSFREEAGVVLGLDLGTRVARAAIANFHGDIIKRTSRALVLEKSESILPQIGLLVQDMLAMWTDHAAKVVSLGVAVPGVVHTTPVPGYVDAAKVFPGLNNRPLRAELEQLLHLPVVIDNDVNLATLGEYQSGCAQQCSDVVYLFVGRGIGAGLLMGGNLFRGHVGAAGEAGNMVVDRVNLYHSFGGRGCLEAMASIDQLVAASQAPGLPPISAEAVCEQAMAGEQRACGAIRTMNEYLAATIINLVAIIDPEIVVLGGDLSELPRADELFMQPIKQLIEQHTGSSAPLRLSQLQADAALYGALQASIDLALDIAASPA
ncbi:MAG: ROK family transcriptional regulator [Ktedonobacteraceae bacterium]|nr:ROK family transcriptional regulator [Chloroflexota bacterium]